MLSVKLIKILNKLSDKIRNHCIGKQEKNLYNVSDKLDMAEELANKRVEMAVEIYLELVNRADSKLIKDKEQIEQLRKEAVDVLEALEKA